MNAKLLKRHAAGERDVSNNLSKRELDGAHFTHTCPFDFAQGGSGGNVTVTKCATAMPGSRITFHILRCDDLCENARAFSAACARWLTLFFSAVDSSAIRTPALGDVENRIVAKTVFAARLERDFPFARAIGFPEFAVRRSKRNRTAKARGAFARWHIAQLVQQKHDPFRVALVCSGIAFGVHARFAAERVHFKPESSASVSSPLCRA